MDTVQETLDRLEKDLLAKIGDLRTALIPLERELNNVRRAKAALPLQLNLNALSFELGLTPPQQDEKISVASGLSPYAGLTMKELTIKALREHFPQGAEATELLDFFHNAWGRRDIKRSSLSPQLSRLKKENDIDLQGNKWVLKQ